MIYFGDTARVPYGTKGEKTVRAFASQDAGVLVELGVKLVVVACNTASAFALEHLRRVLPVPVLGVIEPGVAAALARDPRRGRSASSAPRAPSARAATRTAWPRRCRGGPSSPGSAPCSCPWWRKA